MSQIQIFTPICYETLTVYHYLHNEMCCHYSSPSIQLQLFTNQSKLYIYETQSIKKNRNFGMLNLL